jgi:cell wall-associated NlpC family hydrolase
MRGAWISLALLLLCAFSTVTTAASGSPRFAVALYPTPVLNTPDFRSVFGGKDGNTLATDSCGQIRALEFIALPGTPFRIEAVLDGTEFPVYRVRTDDYPYPSRTGYYIDSRFVNTSETPVQPRPRKLPSRNTILARLSSAVGTAYVWGSNRRDGVTETMAFFPPPSGYRLETLTRDRWTLRGLDCSGLLYEATDGYTPRNTSSLVDYGVPVPIAGQDEDGIAGRMRPLDLIVWKGHVMIVYDRNRIIESRLDCGGKNGGVAFRGLRETLRELLQSRSPLDSWTDGKVNGKKGFVIRRWYPADGAAPSRK